MKSQSHWLTAGRARLYALLVFASSIVFWLLSLILPENLVNNGESPLVLDFMAFWGASHLALAGHAVDAYDIPKMLAAEQLALPTERHGLAWFYLPPYFLAILPLALLPYLEAYLVFMVATLAPYALALRRILQPWSAGIFIVAYPGLWLNLIVGQNGFLTAALAGSALSLLGTRPIMAGVLIGLLVIKPHLGVLFPVALIAAGAWLTLATAGLTAVLLTGLSVWLLGPDTLTASLASLDGARRFLEAGVFNWAKMPTVFTLLQHLGASVTLAYLVHGLVAGLAAISVWRVWRGTGDIRLRGASLMTATLMISPYLYDYDLTWLAFPIAWLALCGIQDGWRGGERWILAGVWLFPLFAAPLARASDLQFGPLVLGALLGMVWRRFARRGTVHAPG